MQVSEEQGALLSILVASLGAESAIEIGTFTGYSSVCIARSLRPGGTLICCDLDRTRTTIAQRYWELAGVQERVELRLGDARVTLRSLDESLSFDFAFIDADKIGYDEYYEALLPHMRVGGMIIFDNMLARGRVLEPKRVEDQALADLNEKLAWDPRIECVLLTVADGLMLCRKR